MASKTSSSLFLYLIIAGVIVALPAIILISNRTVITLDSLFNLFAVFLLLSAIQYKWVKRVTGNTVITFLYFVFGSAPLLLALFLTLNYIIPSGVEKNQDHQIESVDYAGGNIIVTFKDSAYQNDPGMRRFEQEEIEKPPVEMIVRYTMRKGLFGFPVLIDRKIR